MSEFNLDLYLRRTGFACLQPRAALIDMDGTLYDSMPNHARAWHRMATENGIPCCVDEFFAYEGRTGASTINILFQRTFGRDATPEEIKHLYGLKSQYFVELGPVSPMPGAAEMLQAVLDAGMRPVLVTGSGQSSLLSRLDEDFPGVFAPDMRITAHNVSHGKPDPEPYLKAMELAGVKPWQSIVMENAPIGVLAGARSGAFTVAVTTGPIPAADMLSAGADALFPSMPAYATALPTFLKSLKSQ